MASDLPDPLEPHGNCPGLNVWWTATGRARCADCDPPTASRCLLRLKRQKLARESERLWKTRDGERVTRDFSAERGK